MRWAASKVNLVTMTTFPFTFVAREAIAQRRAAMHEYDRARAQNRQMPNPIDNDILLNLLAVQSREERVWREIDSKAFGIAFACLAKCTNARVALVLAVACIIEQINIRFSGDRCRRFICPLTVGLDMVRKALKSAKSSDLMMSHAAYIYDLLRYGAASRDMLICERLSRRIDRQQILVHPVRERHPHGIIVIESLN